jgi:alcohol dehydrogenase
MTAVATRTARAFYMQAPGATEIREFDLPTIGPDDALLKVELAGVCGTDVKILHGRFNGRISFPLIPGHEICGVIEEIGEEAARRWGVDVGSRVAVDSFLACGGCEPCLAGNTRYCTELGDYGVSMGAARPPHLWGGFAEYVYLHRGAQVHRLPPTLTPEHGVLVPAVVANALRWVGDVGGVTVGSSVLIAGPGPIGLASIITARALGAAQVFISGLPSDRHRLDMAARLGADEVLHAGPDLRDAVLDLTDGHGVDVVVDVSGAPQVLPEAVGMVRNQGRIVVGGLTGGRPAALPVDEFALKEITVAGVFSHDRSAVQRGLRMVEDAPEVFAEFVTHRFGLSDVVDAIEKVASGDPTLLKVVVDPRL